MRPSHPLKKAIFANPHSLVLLAFLGLILLLSAAPLLAQTEIETRPVDFMVTGQFDATGGGGLDRVWVRIIRLDTDEVVIDRAFSEPDGSFAAVFTTLLEVTVGLPEDPPKPELPGVSISSFMMGRIGPNPYHSREGDGGTQLLYLSPAGAEAPELEIYDLRGRRQIPGSKTSSGVYFYRLRFGQRLTDARKLLLLSDTLPQVKLVQASSEAQLRGELPAAAQASAKAPEGVLPVRVELRKAGYEGEDLTLELDSTNSNPLSVELNPEAAPTAAFSAQDGVAAGESVVFDASSSVSPDGQALHYTWDFGDGSHADGQAVAHVYRGAGSYDATLTVRSSWGATNSTQSAVSITAGPPPAANDAEMTILVADALGNLLEGVELSQVDGAATGTTGTNGAVSLGGLPTDVPLSLRLSKDGYATQVFPTELPAGTQFTTVELTMRRRRTPIVVARIEDGCVESGEDGVVIDLPPDALQLGDGTPASGEATISLTPVDVTDDLAAKAFPGGYEGVQPDGSRGLILSYGVSEFAIEQGGEALQLVPGAIATIEIPIYTGGVSAGDFVALWSVDGSSGLWTEEGSGEVVVNPDSPSGYSLLARVGHFSWWNADRFDGDPYRPIPRCKIKDNDGLPTLDIPAGDSCYIQGRVLGPNAPLARPTSSVPPGGGRLLPMPAGRSCTFTASAQGGSLRGFIEFVGQANVEEELIIVLDTLDPPPGLIQLPVDQEVSMTTIGEVDIWSLDIHEGQSFSLSVGTASGSSLQGEARLKDPQGQIVDSNSFTSSSFASLLAEEAVGGVWTLEVESTANAPGGYHLVGRLTEIISLAQDAPAVVDLLPGIFQPFRFSLQSGTWYSVEYFRISGSGSRTSWSLRAPDNSSIDSAATTGISVNCGLFRATQDGAHRLDLISQNLSGELRVTVRSVPELIVGGGHEVQASYKGFQYYKVAGTEARMVRAAEDGSSGFRGNYTWVDANDIAQSTVWNYWFGNSDGSAAMVIPAEDLFLRVNSSYSSPQVGNLPYRLGLSYLSEGAALSPDAQGRSEIVGTFSTAGEAKLHLFSAEVGEALEIRVFPEGATPLPSSLIIGVYPLSGGDINSPGSAEQARASGGNIVAGLPPEILELRAYKLGQATTHAILVFDGQDGRGSYRLQMDQLAPSSSIVVDDDLVQRPDADTRSVMAAFLAIQDAGTLEFAEGVHEFYDFLEMDATGATISGAGKDLTTLACRTGGTLLYANSSIGVIRDLSFEAIRRGFDDTITLNQPDGTILEDLRVGPATGSSALAVAIAVSNGSGLIVRRAEILDSLSALAMRNTHEVLVEDCVFNGSAQRVENDGGDENVIRRNTWTITAIGTAIELDNGAGHQILENQIQVNTSDFGATGNTEAIQILDRDDDGSLPMSIVRDNRIVTNEAGFYLRAGRLGGKIVCERNRVEMTDSFGDRALHIVPYLLDGTGTIIARNNVFLGVASYRGIYCQQVEYLEEVWIANNTVELSPTTNTQAGYATIEIARASGSFTGALPVTVVNNVLSGIGSTTAVRISTDCTADSDYNLFHQYATYYTDGSSSTGTNDLLGQDPRLVGDDLTLDDGSPAIDSGATNAQYAEVPADDYAGTSRPQGGGVDRGAHER